MTWTKLCRITAVKKKQQWDLTAFFQSTSVNATVVDHLSIRAIRVIGHVYNRAYKKETNQSFQFVYYI